MLQSDLVRVHRAAAVLSFCLFVVVLPACSEPPAPSLPTNAATGCQAGGSSTALLRRFSHARSSSVIADSRGLLVVGSNDSGASLGGEPLDGPGFVARLDGEGNHSWSRSVTAYLHTAAVDRGGRPIIGGFYSVPVSLGDVSLPSPGSSGGALVALLDEQGRAQWARGLTDDTGALLATALAVAPDGGIVVLGTYRPTPGPELFPNPPFQEGFFLAKLADDGRELWRRRLGGTPVAMGRDMILDALGYATVAVATSGSSVDLGTGSIEPTDQNRLLLAKFDPLGQLVSIKGVSRSSLENIEALAPGPDGSTYAAGYIGSEALGQSYRSEFVVSRFDGTGERMWSKHFSSASQYEGAALSADSCGHIMASSNVRARPTAATHIVRLKETGELSSEDTLHWNEYRWTSGVARGGSGIYLFGSLGQQNEDTFLSRIGM